MNAAKLACNKAELTREVYGGWARALATLGCTDPCTSVLTQLQTHANTSKEKTQLHRVSMKQLHHVSSPDSKELTCWDNCKIGEADKALEMMEMGARAAGDDSCIQSTFWAPAYLMMSNYSSVRSRDEIRHDPFEPRLLFHTRYIMQRMLQPHMYSGSRCLT